MSVLKLVFLPSNLIFFLLIIAVVSFSFRRWRHLSYIPFIFSAIVYIVMGSGTVSALLLSPLEYRYSSIQNTEAHPDIKNIVVLTAYVADDPSMPLSGKFNSSSLFRIVEAHNIYKQCVDCKIILSGTGKYVDLMHEQFLVFGVPEEAIEDDPVVGHTIDSALSLAKKLTDKKLFLVTSAGHMRRAMGVFKKNGLDPIAAPTDYLMPKDFMNASIMPGSQHLHFSDLAVNEYAGILWYQLTDRM